MKLKKRGIYVKLFLGLFLIIGLGVMIRTVTWLTMKSQFQPVDKMAGTISMPGQTSATPTPTKPPLPEIFQNPPPVPEDWKTYVNEELRFKIRYPAKTRKYLYQIEDNKFTDKDSDTEWGVEIAPGDHWMPNSIGILFGPKLLSSHRIVEPPFMIFTNNEKFPLFPEKFDYYFLDRDHPERGYTAGYAYLIAGQIHGSLRIRKHPLYDQIGGYGYQVLFQGIDGHTYFRIDNTKNLVKEFATFVNSFEFLE